MPSGYEELHAKTQHTLVEFLDVELKLGPYLRTGGDPSQR
jgi:hypothetical protein